MGPSCSSSLPRYKSTVSESSLVAQFLLEKDLGDIPGIGGAH